MRIYGARPKVLKYVDRLRTQATSSEQVCVQERALNILDVQAEYGHLFRAALVSCFEASRTTAHDHGHKVYTNKLQWQAGLKTIWRAERPASVLRQAAHTILGHVFLADYCGCKCVPSRWVHSLAHAF